MNGKQRNSNYVCKLPEKAKQLEGQGTGGRIQVEKGEGKYSLYDSSPLDIVIYPMIFFLTLLTATSC